jgi:hypothetical protein
MRTSARFAMHQWSAQPRQQSGLLSVFDHLVATLSSRRILKGPAATFLAFLVARLEQVTTGHTATT